MSDPWNWVLLATITLLCAAFWFFVTRGAAEARLERHQGPGRLTLWLARKGGGYRRDKQPDRGAIRFAERVLSALVFWVPFVLLCWWAEWR